MLELDVWHELFELDKGNKPMGLGSQVRGAVHTRERKDVYFEQINNVESVWSWSETQIIHVHSLNLFNECIYMKEFDFARLNADFCNKW